jgi:hypothetical protein
LQGCSAAKLCITLANKKAEAVKMRRKTAFPFLFLIEDWKIGRLKIGRLKIGRLKIEDWKIESRSVGMENYKIRRLQD